MELNQNTEKLDNYRKRAAELVGKMTLEEKWHRLCIRHRRWNG